jgi:hypothetical protein
MQYIVGDVKFNTDISPLQDGGTLTIHQFMNDLQDLMELYAVTRIDISIDPYKFAEYKNQQV